MSDLDLKDPKLKYRRLVWKQRVRERQRHPKQKQDWPFIILMAISIGVIFLLKCSK